MPKHSAESTGKKRRGLTLYDKLKIIEYAKSSGNSIKHNDIAVHFGCGQSTVTKILQQKQLLEQEQKGISLKSQRQREPNWMAMEQALITWINQALAHNLTITDEIVRMKAKDFAAAIYTSSDNLLSSFSASDGWLSEFKTRYSFKSYRLLGEAASAPVQDLDETRSKLRETLAKFQLEDIFNADETGLFFRLLSNQTLATSSHKGTKKDKERITGFLTSNVTGTEKLKPIVIGKFVQPR